jgi:hypothetical protein
MIVIAFEFMLGIVSAFSAIFQYFQGLFLYIRQSNPCPPLQGPSLDHQFVIGSIKTSGGGEPILGTIATGTN